MPRIERSNSAGAVLTVTADAATTPVVSFGPSAGGMVFVTALSTATTLNWYATYSRDVTPGAVSDGTADVSTTVAAGKSYPIPDALYGAPFIAIVTNAGTASVVITVKG